MKVDLIVRKDGPFRREELRRRRRVRIDGFEVFVVTAEDLVLSKLEWARESRSEMQLRDVRNLLASVPDLDRAHLDRWAQEIGVGDLLRDVST